MKSIFVLCGVLGAVTDASECQADESSLLQSRSAVRMIKDRRSADTKALLKNMRDVANSLLEGSDTTMTADEVTDALDAASNALAELSPAIRQQVENAQQQINDAAAAVQVCHAQEQAELRSSLRESAGQRAAAVESCHSALDQLRADETRQCGIAEDCLCDEARVRTTGQEALCTSMTETYEAAFCEHHHVCTIFHQCHVAEAEVFARLRADVEAELALTVQEYIAVEQSRCLTGLIMEAMTPPVTPISHAALIACDDVDVSAIRVDYPALPAEPPACPAHQHGEPECVTRPDYIQTPNREYCPDNQNIMTEEECRQAADALHLEWNSAWRDPRDHRYCQFTGSRGVYFNTAGYAIRPQGPHYYSLCRARPDYIQTSNREYCPDSRNIETEEECRQAAEELHLEWNSAWRDPSDHRYCQFTGSRGVYFNTAGYAIRPQGPHYYSLCKAPL